MSVWLQNIIAANDSADKALLLETASGSKYLNTENMPVPIPRQTITPQVSCVKALIKLSSTVAPWRL